MFMDLPGHSDTTNRQISPSSINWCPQIGLAISRRSRTTSSRSPGSSRSRTQPPPPTSQSRERTTHQMPTSSSSTSELGMFLDLPGRSEDTNRQISASSIDWWSQIGLGGPGTYLTHTYEVFEKSFYQIIRPDNY